MSNRQTAVPLPPTAANYTLATIDEELRSQIVSILHNDGHIQKLQEHLLEVLHSNNANWPTTIQNHASNLLRSGEVTTFPALIRRVMDDIRQASAQARGGTGSSAKANGDKKAVNGADAAPSSSKQNLAFPDAVATEAVRLVREVLNDIVEEDDS